MLAHSFLIESSSKLLVTRTGIKAWTSSISGLWFPWPIYMFLKWDLTLAHWTQVSDRCPLGYLFYIFFIRSSSMLLDIFIFVFNLYAMAYFYIWIQSLFISIVYVSFFYSIFDHLYLIINDLYAIVIYYYSMTSIYVPNVSFLFCITIYVLYNSDLYSIFSYLYLICVHFYSIFLIYILSFYVSII